MERRILVGIFQPKYGDHLQRWSWKFRSEKTETNFSIWIPTEISGIFGIMESTPADRLDRFPAVDQSVSWIARANFVPLRILLSRILRK